MKLRVRTMPSCIKCRVSNKTKGKFIVGVSFICLFLAPVRLFSKEPTNKCTYVDLSIEEAQLPRVLPRLRRLPSSFKKMPNGWKAPVERIRKSSVLRNMGDDVLRQVMKDSSWVSNNYTGSYGIVKPIEFYNSGLHYSPYQNSYNPLELHTTPGIFIPKYLNLSTDTSSGMFRIKEIDISPYGNRQIQFQIDTTILNIKSTSDALGIDLDLLEWEQSE